MSVENQAPSGEADSSVQKPVAAQIPAPESSEQKDPNWLPARLERERKAFLKELGVEDVSNAKAALAELKKRQDAEKTELERLKSENDSLKKHASRIVELESAMKLRSDAELAALTESQREAVMAVAGESPDKIIMAIAKMKDAGMFAPPAASPAAQPATTAPPAASKPTPASSAPANHLATYERLRKENPMLASRYRLNHFDDIQAEMKARG